MTSELTTVPYEGLEIAFDDNGDPWMSQQQIADMLGISRQNVGNMLAFAFDNGDIDDHSVRNLRLQAADGKFYNVKHYSLDAILTVGFRSKATTRAIAFRKWINGIVLDYIHRLQDEKAHLAELYGMEQQLRRTAEWDAYAAESESDDLRRELLEQRYGDLDGIEEWDE